MLQAGVKAEVPGVGSGGATQSTLPRLAGVAGRDETLRKEEESALLRFNVITNDGTLENLRMLIDLKNIYSKQLPNMPKDYIVKLVFDNRHKSLLLLRGENHLVGGITYRPFYRQGFGEIAFCAVSAVEQVKGYGSRLMAHLKVCNCTWNIAELVTFSISLTTGVKLRRIMPLSMRSFLIF